MLGTVIVGVTASMEEARASKNEIDGETINDEGRINGTDCRDWRFIS